MHVLHLDRYLTTARGVFDLATAAPVHVRTTHISAAAVTLFATHAGQLLIDEDARGDSRVEVWEDWSTAPPTARRDSLAQTVADFSELLDDARWGVPRAFAVPRLRAAEGALLQRMLAHEARVRGWLPVASQVLAALPSAAATLPAALTNRSLAIFCAEQPWGWDTLPHKLAVHDGRPHVLVHRRIGRQMGRVAAARSHVRHSRAASFTVRETAPAWDNTAWHHTAAATAPQAPELPAAGVESAARWRYLVSGREAGFPDASLALSRVLMARGQLYGARALVEQTSSQWAGVSSPPMKVVAETTALSAEIRRLGSVRTRKEWEMVDDFVDVLRLCQDVEDEELALARVGAFVRDRLQASSVAFVIRDGSASRVLARVGSTQPPLDLAVRTIDSGVSVPPARAEGPVESASPVRHAAEVIGVLWARWSAGAVIAPQQAATLLGVAAAAAAPSVRLVMSRAPLAAAAHAVPELVGASAAIGAARDAIVRAAASPFPVVIEGESGSGKELAARAIHTRSNRRNRRFCPINCAALVDDLVEAELFGHARGAFTGATADRTGVFEDASGGTLFLDEVAELGPRVQAKLLRVLQEGEVRRVGETAVRKVDVRIVAATNRPLAAAVAANSFRADLWYRLNVVRIALPPLRERVEDIPLLAQHLWHGLTARVGRRAVLAPATVAALAAYDWPGNVRELQNVLASLLVASPRGGLIGPGNLPQHIGRVAALSRSVSLADARRQFDARYVKAALARAGGRTGQAARELGLSRQGLSKLLVRLELGRTEGNVPAAAPGGHNIQ